jgi:hypothetical protein
MLPKVATKEHQMDCISFVVFIGGGAAIVPFLEWLKRWPRVGAVVEQWAFLLAPMLAALVPVIAEAATPLCYKVDPNLWLAAYYGLTFLATYLTYRIGKMSGRIA